MEVVYIVDVDVGDEPSTVKVMEAPGYSKKTFCEAEEYFSRNPLEEDYFNSKSLVKSGIKKFPPFEGLYVFFSEDSKFFISREKKLLEDLHQDIMSRLRYEGKTFIFKNGQVSEASREESFILTAEISRRNGYSSFEQISEIYDFLSRYTIRFYSDHEYTELFTFRINDEYDYDDEVIMISRNLQELEKFARSRK